MLPLRPIMSPVNSYNYNLESYLFELLTSFILQGTAQNFHLSL